MMPNNVFYPVVFIVVIISAIYFMYGDAFSSKQVDLGQYMQLCEQYRTAAKGKYSDDELQMLISEISYLVPDEVNQAEKSRKHDLKSCAQDLRQKLKK